MNNSYDENRIIGNVKNEVRQLFCNEFSGHDMLHTLRVVNNAEALHRSHGGDSFIITLAALLHDADDKKLSPDTYKNKDNARKILYKNGISEEDTERIIGIISTVSFSDGIEAETIEAKIVQDADRLDALGAIGIARCFAYGGSHGRAIYTEDDLTGDSIQSDSSISHFYKKLLKLSHMMQTAEGRKEAEKRTAFISSFLERFIRETDISDERIHFD